MRQELMNIINKYGYDHITLFNVDDSIFEHLIFNTGHDTKPDIKDNIIIYIHKTGKNLCYYGYDYKLIINKVKDGYYNSSFLGRENVIDYQLLKAKVRKRKLKKLI
jgi:hypothetical protein